MVSGRRAALQQAGHRQGEGPAAHRRHRDLGIVQRPAQQRHRAVSPTRASRPGLCPPRRGPRSTGPGRPRAPPRTRAWKGRAARSPEAQAAGPPTTSRGPSAQTSSTVKLAVDGGASRGEHLEGRDTSSGSNPSNSTTCAMHTASFDAFDTLPRPPGTTADLPPRFLPPQLLRSRRCTGSPSSRCRGRSPSTSPPPIEVLGRGPRAYEAGVVAGAEASQSVDAGPLRIVPGHGLAALDEGGHDRAARPGRPRRRLRSPTQVLDRLRTAAHNRGCRIVSICVGRLHPRRHRPARRAPGHHPLATPPTCSARPTRGGAPSIRRCSTWTPGSSSPRPAPRRGWTCACTWSVGTAEPPRRPTASRLAVSPAAPRRRSGPVRRADTGTPTRKKRRASLWPPCSPGSRSTPDRDLTLDEIAGRAGVSIRTLNRRFHDEIGAHPDPVADPDPGSGRPRSCSRPRPMASSE